MTLGWLHKKPSRWLDFQTTINCRENFISKFSHLPMSLKMVRYSSESPGNQVFLPPRQNCATFVWNHTGKESRIAVPFHFPIPNSQLLLPFPRDASEQWKPTRVKKKNVILWLSGSLFQGEWDVEEKPLLSVCLGSSENGNTKRNAWKNVSTTTRTALFTSLFIGSSIETLAGIKAFFYVLLRLENPRGSRHGGFCC